MWLDGQGNGVGSGPTLHLAGSNGVDTVYFYDTDAIGSVRQITDANGAVVGHIRDFLPFGSEYPDQSLLNDHRVSFAGKERDPESNLDYFLARYFSKDIGRFFSADPIRFSPERLTDPRQWNLFTYARNNPLRFIDPTGNEDCPIWEDGTAHCSDTVTVTGAGNGSYVWPDPRQFFNVFGMEERFSRPTISAAPTPWYQNPCIMGALGNGGLRVGIDAIGLIPEGGAIGKIVTRALGNYAGWRGIVATQQGAKPLEGSNWAPELPRLERI